jgi:hypothetical protein
MARRPPPAPYQKTGEPEIKRQDGADQKANRQDMGGIDEHVERRGAPQLDRKRRGSQPFEKLHDEASVRLDAFRINIVALFTNRDAHRLQPLLCAVLRPVSECYDLIARLCDTFHETRAFRLARIAEFDAPDTVIDGCDIERRMRPAHRYLLDDAAKLYLVGFRP